MAWLADLTLKHDLKILSDEAYFKILYTGRGKSIASLPGMRERTVILYTFSKTYAMTGWRLGAAIGPEQVIEQMVKLNVNIESCTNHFIQYAGVEALNGDQTGAESILRTLRGRRDTLLEELRQIDGVSVFNPNSTFYLFPDVTAVYERSGASSLEEFRLRTLRETGVAFCTREHFGSLLPGETGAFLRFAFSGIPEEKIREGFTRLRAAWS
jgi:aspartate/methionine/tyrosine aminotransferase